MTVTQAPTPQAVADLLGRLEMYEMAGRRADAEYRRGWADGARGQFEEGYVAAIADVKHAQHVTVAQLAPGGAAWLAAVERHGGTEYGGAGKPRVPVDPVAVELARMMLRGRAA